MSRVPGPADAVAGKARRSRPPAADEKLAGGRVPAVGAGLGPWVVGVEAVVAGFVGVVVVAAAGAGEPLLLVEAGVVDVGAAAEGGAGVEVAGAGATCAGGVVVVVVEAAGG